MSHAPRSDADDEPRQQIFTLTRLDKVLEIHDSTEAAVNSLSPG